MRKEEDEDEARAKMSRDQQKAADAKKRMQAADTEKRMRELAMKDKKAGDHYVWEFLGGQFIKKHLEPGQAPRLQMSGSTRLPTNAYSVTAELPLLMISRIIGKGGANIKATEAKSGARVQILQGYEGASEFLPCGATEAKSGARVQILLAKRVSRVQSLQAGQAKLAVGMAGVHISGTHSSIESARALINKNLASGGAPR
eukprot:gene8822-74_t